MSAESSSCVDDSGATGPTSASANDNLPPYRILALYIFVKIPRDELPSLKAEVETTLRSANARGTILLAPEGINGTISYPPPQVGDNNTDDGDDADKHDAVLQYLQSHKYFGGLRTRKSLSKGGHVFHRLKIKQKNEIVTIGCDRPAATAGQTADAPGANDCCACSGVN